MGMTDRQKQTIQAALQAKGVAVCPMCRRSGWQVGEDLVHAPATSLGGGMSLGGPHIPMAQIVCTNCGFVSHHAVGVLGIALK